jgi:DNA-binding CsgD family transcriptional regulator
MPGRASVSDDEVCEELPRPAGLEVRRTRAGDGEVVWLRWPGGGPAAVPALAGLGEAQRQVLRLVLDGLTSAEIAARRGRSRRTVEHQLAAIYRKLGVSGRLELFARFAAARPLGA